MRYFQTELFIPYFCIFFPLTSTLWALHKFHLCFKKIMWNMLHRTGKEEGAVDSNGKWLWKKSSTYGKYMRIIWNNLGNLLVLKIYRQWRKVTKLGRGWEDAQLTSENTDCHHVPHKTGESLWLHTGKHFTTSRNLSTTVFLPSSSFRVTFLPTSVAINILWVTFHSKYRLLSNGCDIPKY